MAPKPTAVPADAAPQSTEPTSGFHVRRVVHEFVPVAPDSHGKSHGQILDEMILDALESRGQIDSVEIVITDRDWAVMRMVAGY